MSLRPSANTIADSISVDCPRDGYAAVRAILESDGFAICFDDDDILDGVGKLAREEGVFSEPSAAASYLAVNALFERFSSDDIVVCLATGSGLKNTNALLQGKFSVPRLVECGDIAAAIATTGSSNKEGVLA